MSITTNTKHDHCEVYIDCNTQNASGQPALLCKQHIVKKGKRAGKQAFIQWLSTEDFKLLYSDPQTHIVGDPVPHLHKKTEFSVSEHTTAVRKGQREPMVDVSNTFTRQTPFWY